VETDEKLVKRTLSGETHCYGLLVQRHADYLFGLGMRLTAGHRELAEDISQQSFLRAYAYLKSFNPKRKFKHWLTGIAVNCYKDLIRKENQYLSLEVIDEPSYTPHLGGNTDFFNLIKPLTEDEKALFTLRYVYEYHINEIADFLGLKSGTVKSRISRALEKLR
jgi:RNA polymerase sigma-70 factor (ECF subfamily)